MPTGRLFDRKEWPPARHTRDSKAPPTAFGNMATPITRAEVLNLIQSKPSTNGAGLAKKGVCHKCNKPGHWSRECPENNKGKGRNGSGNERPKDVKSSWKSAPPPSGAPQVKQANGKTFNWCASCKRWTTTHATATHTGGGKKGADGANGGGTAINNVSLAFDPSVWTTEIEVVPSVTDALFVLRTMVTRIPVLVVLLTYVMAIFSVPFAKTMWSATLENFQLAMAHFNAIDWNQVITILRARIMVVRPHVSQFLETHQVALIAPFLWLLMATVVLFWLPKVASTPPEPDPKEGYRLAAIVVLSSNTIARSPAERMLLKLAASAPMDCTADTPLTCRSMGHYIRRNAPTLVEQQQQVQLNTLHSKVAALLHRVDCLKRSISRSSTRWTCRHCNDTIVHGPTQPCPTLRGTSRSSLQSTMTRRKEESIAAISPTPTTTLHLGEHLDAVLVDFPSQVVSIVLSHPLVSKA